MLIAGYTGWLEILIIVICIFWLLNAYRKNSILRKMEEELDARKQDRNSREKTKTVDKGKNIPRNAEFVDYEEIK
jgi:hypothetical protein